MPWKPRRSPQNAPIPRPPIDILLVGEQRIFRDALRKLFDGARGFNVVGDASDVGQAMKAIAALNPDVVIVNVPGRRLARMMPSMRELTDAGSHARTILLTTTIEKTHILQAQELRRLGNPGERDAAAGAVGERAKRRGRPLLARAQAARGSRAGAAAI